MEKLLKERDELEERIRVVNMDIIRIGINEEMNVLRGKLNEITNENFQRGMDYIYLANILGVYNYRGKGYDKLFDEGLKKLNIDREYVERINNLYGLWLEWINFKSIENEYNLALRIKNYGEPKDDLIINRP